MNSGCRNTLPLKHCVLEETSHPSTGPLFDTIMNLVLSLVPKPDTKTGVWERERRIVYAATMESRFFLSLLLLFLVYIPARKKTQDADLERILRGLLREEGFRRVDIRNKVAVGFGSCEDVFADGYTYNETSHHDI